MSGTTKAPKVGYEAGDTVYAHADSGPLVLRVLASGKDGFTGESEDGERHKVPHDRYLGHQRRMKHAYEVCDEGEDGCLVADETGQRRFIKGKPPTPEKDKPPRDNAHRFSRLHTEDLKVGPMGTLTKALMLAPLPPLPEGMALLLKAATPGAVRPISPQPEGRPKPKKPTGSKEKKPGPALHKHGDFVAFRHEDVVGMGRIVGSGADGCSILDEETGREHLVRHDAILPEHPPEPKVLEETDKDATLGGGSESDASRIPALKPKGKQPPS